MESGFYKETNGQWLYAPNRVKGSNYELDINKFEDYTYPIDGWVYFPTAPMEYLDYLDSLQVDEFDPFPDNEPIDPEVEPEPEVIEDIIEEEEILKGKYYKHNEDGSWLRANSVLLPCSTLLCEDNKICKDHWHYEEEEPEAYLIWLESIEEVEDDILYID